MNEKFDYIIVGAGGAGLSLIMRMLNEASLNQKKILIIDRAPKSANDRTWCFWEKGRGFFEHLISHKWENLWVKHPKGDINLSMGGYAYKMIRGADFYKYCFGKIREAGNRIKIVYGNVTEILEQEGKITVDGLTYEGEIIFSSVLISPPKITGKQFYLLQHFRGWWIETEQDAFDPEQAELMNFRVPQTHGCSFVYVLPISPRRALIEYTLFSGEELTSKQYDDGLTFFLKHELKISGYNISEVENGIIPMTNYLFPAKQGKVIYIGTAGGQTKASTGYTFSNMQKHADRIVQGLVLNNPHLLEQTTPARFRLYDSILLRVLDEGKMPGADVFFSIFSKNPASRVFRFLDNDSSLADEAAIILKAPRRTFSGAAIREIF